MTAHVLAFEAFDGGSHRAFRDAIADHGKLQWTWVTRPPRAWKWRLRLSALEMAREVADRKDLPPADVVFTTSMTHLGDLIAALPKKHRDARFVMYMHENQAVYPLSEETKPHVRGDVQFALTQLSSLLVADRVLWNSEWNRQSFLDGVSSILRHARDHRLENYRERILEKSAIVWPPVDILVQGRETRPPGQGFRVVWPHRWEHDKGPEELVRLAEEHTQALGIRWTILGESYGKQPEVLTSFRERFAPWIDHIGFIPDRKAYQERIAGCDFVLSTARHEFFGIAVTEALLLGCLPWLPDRLSYPELLPVDLLDVSPLNVPQDRAGTVSRIRAHLERARAPNAVARLESLLSEGSG